LAENPNQFCSTSGEHVPGVQQSRIETRLGGRLLFQEAEILDDAVVQRPVFRFLAIEEQERINEQRKVGKQRDIECSVLVQRRSTDAEEVGKIHSYRLLHGVALFRL